jgi:hypothetical protein
MSVVSRILGNICSRGIRMMTVHEVGQHYGVTDGFMVRALDQIGFKNAKPNTALPTDTVTLFEAKFGEKIRAKRPRTPAAARKPKPHVMRIAHSEVTAVRVSSGHIEKRLLDSPWGVHAIDAAGTRDGDPWDGEVVPGAVYFYDGSTSSGPRAACGFAHMRAVLGDEFVPAEEPSLAGQCTRCAKIVAARKGFREPARPFGYHRSYFCETTCA